MPEPFHFAGFAGPRYTQTPDEVFDVLLPVLSGAELKVLLYIIRRTFGWRKDADRISLSQIQHGITRADGAALDHGTGLAKSTAVAAIKGLETMGIIEAVRSKSDARGYESTTYRLRLAAPLSENRTSHVQKSDPPLVRESDRQQTTESTNRENGSDELHRAALKADLRARCKRYGVTLYGEQFMLDAWLASADRTIFSEQLNRVLPTANSLTQAAFDMGIREQR